LATCGDGLQRSSSSDLCWSGEMLLVVQLDCVFDVQYPGDKAEKENLCAIPALLRLKLWLGLEQHEPDWHKLQTEGVLSVYAETVSDPVIQS